MTFENVYIVLYLVLMFVYTLQLFVYPRIISTTQHITICIGFDIYFKVISIYKFKFKNHRLLAYFFVNLKN